MSNHQNNHLFQQVTVITECQLCEEGTIKVCRIGIAGVTTKRDAGILRDLGFDRNQTKQFCRQEVDIWATDSVNGENWNIRSHEDRAEIQKGWHLSPASPPGAFCSISASVGVCWRSSSPVCCLQTHEAKPATTEQHIFFTHDNLHPLNWTGVKTFGKLINKMYSVWNKSI